MGINELNDLTAEQLEEIAAGISPEEYLRILEELKRVRPKLQAGLALADEDLAAIAGGISPDELLGILQELGKRHPTLAAGLALADEELEAIAGGVSFDELRKVAEMLEKRRNPGQQTVGGIADGHSFGPTQETEDDWMNQR